MYELFAGTASFWGEKDLMNIQECMEIHKDFE